MEIAFLFRFSSTGFFFFFSIPNFSFEIHNSIKFHIITSVLFVLLFWRPRYLSEKLNLFISFCSSSCHCHWSIRLYSIRRKQFDLVLQYITDNPKPDITWTKGGDSSVQSTSEEFISNKPEERSKIFEPCSYSCKAENSFGVNASITVTYNLLS